MASLFRFGCCLCRSSCSLLCSPSLLFLLSMRLLCSPGLLFILSMMDRICGIRDDLRLHFPQGLFARHCYSWCHCLPFSIANYGTLNSQCCIFSGLDIYPCYFTGHCSLYCFHRILCRLNFSSYGRTGHYSLKCPSCSLYLLNLLPGGVPSHCSLYYGSSALILFYLSVPSAVSCYVPSHCCL